MARTRTMIFKFEELPLLIDLGFEAAQVNGEASINYTADVSDFDVTDIWLVGFKEVTHSEEAKLIARLTGKRLPRFIENLVPVERGSWLFGEIARRLDRGRWHENVCEEIGTALIEDSETAPGNLADRRHAEGVA